MKFDTSVPLEFEAAFEYLSKLGSNHSLVEVKKVSPKRSLNQNNYLYLTFGIFAAESGYTAEEAKTIYKREVNPRIYVYEKKGQRFLRSSADLTTKEMSDSIDKWRLYAGDNGIDIPAPGEEEKLRYWGNVIEQQSNFI